MASMAAVDASAMVRRAMVFLGDMVGSVGVDVWGS